MLLACKFEEVNPLAVDEFVYISDGAYSKDEILRMESMAPPQERSDLARGRPCDQPPRQRPTRLLRAAGLPPGPERRALAAWLP